MPDRIDTIAVRGGEPRKNAYDAVTTPIVCAATYVFEDTAEIVDYFEGRKEREEYGRYGNPTVRAAERKIAALEGAEDCALFASGMAAVTTAMPLANRAQSSAPSSAAILRSAARTVGLP